MVKAARMVHVQYILNVALNAEKKVIAAWAGDLEKAHAEGVAFIRKWSQCESITGDIVVTSNGGSQPPRHAPAKTASSSCAAAASTVWAERILRN